MQRSKRCCRNRAWRLNLNLARDEGLKWFIALCLVILHIRTSVTRCLPADSTRHELPASLVGRSVLFFVLVLILLRCEHPITTKINRPHSRARFFRIETRRFQVEIGKLRDNFVGGFLKKKIDRQKRIGLVICQAHSPTGF